jgi:hypothetical protein
VVNTIRAQRVAKVFQAFKNIRCITSFSSRFS